MYVCKNFQEWVNSCPWEGIYAVWTSNLHNMCSTNDVPGINTQRVRTPKASVHERDGKATPGLSQRRETSKKRDKIGRAANTTERNDTAATF